MAGTCTRALGDRCRCSTSSIHRLMHLLLLSAVERHIYNSGQHVMSEFSGQVEVAQQHEHGPALPDVVLIQRLQRGCSECFSLLFHRYCHTVYSIAWRVLRDRAEAEDIVQDVFLSIHLQRSRYDCERGTVKTWILHAVHFRALTRRRQLKGTLLDSIESGQPTDQSLSSTFQSSSINADRVQWIRRGLTHLNDRQRRVIELIHFEGYTLLESSAILGESLANTRNLYYRGMKLLRTSLLPSSGSNALETEMTQKENVILQPKTPVLEH
jgi:RNA polymerase sigma-70 factor, ECF subfamily